MQIVLIIAWPTLYSHYSRTHLKITLIRLTRQEFIMQVQLVGFSKQPEHSPSSPGRMHCPVNVSGWKTLTPMSLLNKEQICPLESVETSFQGPRNGSWRHTRLEHRVNFIFYLYFGLAKNSCSFAELSFFFPPVFN